MTQVARAATPFASSAPSRSARFWPPYAVGVGIGLLSIFAFATADHGLGITTPFEQAAGFLEYAVNPTDGYLSQPEKAPKIDWEWLVVMGVFVGAWLASRAGRAAPAGPVDDEKPTSPQRLGLAFAGGVLLMVGARLAGGCTSGHGITGALQLAVSSWVFLPIIFLSGTVVARLLYARTGASNG